MNRAERRKQHRKGITVESEPVINIKASELQNLKKQITSETTDTAFFLMLAIPVMVLHDKYSQLMRKEVNGKSRAERFADLCLDLYDSFDKGYVTLDDLSNCLLEETGIRLLKK